MATKLFTKPTGNPLLRWGNYALRRPLWSPLRIPFFAYSFYSLSYSLVRGIRTPCRQTNYRVRRRHQLLSLCEEPRNMYTHTGKGLGNRFPMGLGKGHAIRTFQE